MAPSQAGKDKKCVVVGGGLVGCMSSLLLARDGYSVDVFEMREGEGKGAPTTVPASGPHLSGAGVRGNFRHFFGCPLPHLHIAPKRLGRSRLF